MDVTSDQSADHRMQLPDGRQLSYRRFGAAEGLAVLALHGTPGSRLKFSAADAPARALGLRMVAPDRWGYGGTEAPAVPSLAAFAADMRCLLDHLAIERAVLMGVSGGGPYAVAVAAVMPERIAAVALAAPVGPIAGEPRSGFRLFHRFCFGPYARSERAVQATFHIYRRILHTSPDRGVGLASLLGPPADKRIISDPSTRARLAATFREGLRPGARGPAIDLAIFARAWNVDPGAITAPTCIWIGDRDASVPIPAVHRLARKIGTATLVEMPGEGHLWAAHNYATMLGWIAEAAIDGAEGAAAPVQTSSQHRP